MEQPELAHWLWLGVLAIAVAMCGMIVATSAWLDARARRRASNVDYLRPLLLAYMTGAESSTCRDALLGKPAAALDLLARLAWLVRGAWLDRLRSLVRDPALHSMLRQQVTTGTRAARGLAAQLLGLAGDDADLATLTVIAERPDARGDAAAVGLARGWSVATPAVLTALAGLESRRPDLLRTVLPQLDRAALLPWLVAKDAASPLLPLALFIAGRLELAIAPELIIAGCTHPRAQVRRAACLAAQRSEHRVCLPALRRLVADDGEPLVRVAALHALGRLPDPDNLPLLRRVLDRAPWLVQAQAVPVILAHGEAGRTLLAHGQHGAWRSGAVRWIRELAPASSEP